MPASDNHIGDGYTAGNIAKNGSGRHILALTAEYGPGYGGLGVVQGWQRRYKWKTFLLVLVRQLTTCYAMPL